jgi:hypothetical protein
MIGAGMCDQCTGCSDSSSSLRRGVQWTPCEGGGHDSPPIGSPYSTSRLNTARRWPRLPASPCRRCRGRRNRLARAQCKARPFGKASPDHCAAGAEDTEAAAGTVGAARRQAEASMTCRTSPCAASHGMMDGQASIARTTACAKAVAMSGASITRRAVPVGLGMPGLSMARPERDSPPHWRTPRPHGRRPTPR